MVQPANKRLVTEAALAAKDYITAAEVQTIEGPEGPQGPPGADGAPGTNATITSATASGLAAGASPTVTLGGTASARTFSFGIPAGAQGTQGVKGDTGDAGAQGPAGTITSATATGLAAGASPTITLGGTASARTMEFGIPAGATGSAGSSGAAATIAVESTVTGAAGSSASVTNQGTSSAANFRFTIPRGDTGAQGTAGTNGTNGTNGTSADITDVSASGLAAGASPTATLGGTALARTIAFGIPAGAAGTNGTNGTNGTSADITSVSATGLAAGASPTATLGGTALARTIAFGIPAGAAGAAGTNATITGATAVTLAAGSSATVTMGGTASARTFEFGIPRGDTGASGGGGGTEIPMPRVLVTGRWVNTTITGTSMATQAATANRMYLVAFVPHRNRSIDLLGCNVSTSATGNIRMGLYNADSTTGLPTTVLLDPGATVSAGTTGGKSQTAVITLTAGTQYFTAITCTSAATFTAGSANEMWPVAGGVSQSNVGSNHGYVTQSADSALANLTGVTITWASGNVPMCTMRIA